MAVGRAEQEPPSSHGFRLPAPADAARRARRGAVTPQNANDNGPLEACRNVQKPDRVHDSATLPLIRVRRARKSLQGDDRLPRFHLASRAQQKQLGEGNRRVAVAQRGCSPKPGHLASSVAVVPEDGGNVECTERVASTIGPPIPADRFPLVAANARSRVVAEIRDWASRWGSRRSSANRNRRDRRVARPIERASRWVCHTSAGARRVIPRIPYSRIPVGHEKR